jgi:type III secretion protein T
MSITDLVHLLPGLYDALRGYVSLLAICAVRLTMIVMLFPPIDSAVVPNMVRTGIVLVFSMFVAYGQPATMIEDLGGLQLIFVAAREALIGLVIGFAASSVFWTAQGAGTLVDDLTGYNHVQISNPNNPVTFTPTSLLFGQIATAVFWTLGGMISLLGVLYESYHWWPIASSTPVGANILESFAMHQTDTLMSGIAKLAAPLMLVLLLVDVGFGMISRAAPRLDLMSLSQPIKAALVALMLAQFVVLFIENMRGELTLQHLGEQVHSVTAPPLAASEASP